MSLFLFIFFISAFTLSFAKNTSIIYNKAHSSKDKRLNYEIEVLKLALEKILDKYGKYQIVPSKNRISKKKVYPLENPFVKMLNKGYKKYNFNF